MSRHAKLKLVGPPRKLPEQREDNRRSTAGMTRETAGEEAASRWFVQEACSRVKNFKTWCDARDDFGDSQL